MKRKIAVAAVSFLLTISAGMSAIVSMSTNTTLGGTAQGVSLPTTPAAFQQVLSPTLFQTNVYLYDAPTVPLHLRLPATSNTVVASLNGMRGDLSIAAGSTNMTVEAAGGVVTIGAAFSLDWYVAKTNGDWIVEQYPNVGIKMLNGDWIPVYIYTNTSGAKFASFGGAGAAAKANVYFGSLALSAEFASDATFSTFGQGTRVSHFGRGSSNIYIGASGPWGTVTNFHIYANPTFDNGLSFPGSTNKLEIVNSQLTYGGEPIGGGGGGGLSTARVSATDTSVVAGDYLIWLDTRGFTASQSVTLTLPDMDADAQTIVVRRLGNDGAATIARGTNTWTLAYDGDGVTVDWLKAAMTWFWRTF